MIAATRATTLTPTVSTYDSLAFRALHGRGPLLLTAVIQVGLAIERALRLTAMNLIVGRLDHLRSHRSDPSAPEVVASGLTVLETGDPKKLARPGDMLRILNGGTQRVIRFAADLDG